MKNDCDYEKYLKWCEKEVKIPMDKEVLIKEIEANEDYINSITKL